MGQIDFPLLVSGYGTEEDELLANRILETMLSLNYSASGSVSDYHKYVEGCDDISSIYECCGMEFFSFEVTFEEAITLFNRMLLMGLAGQYNVIFVLFLFRKQLLNKKMDISAAMGVIDTYFYESSMVTDIRGNSKEITKERKFMKELISYGAYSEDECFFAAFKGYLRGINL